MTETNPTQAEVRSFVDHAASAGGTGQLFFGDSALHAEEKARRARFILQAMEVQEPVLRPLWCSEAISGTSPARCPDAELQVTAGPAYVVCLSPQDLETFERFAEAFAQQSNMEVHLDELMNPGEMSAKEWTRVVKALRWLALTDNDRQAVASSLGGFQQRTD